MRILGRIVGVQSTEQSVGIKVGAFAPTSYNTTKHKITLPIAERGNYYEKTAVYTL